MANIDGDATGASANDVADDATAKADDVNGTKQTATSNDPFLMAQADVAATNPNALVQGVYDAPTGVTLDDIDTQGADLLVTLPTGDVLRIEDAVSQFGQVEIAGVLFSIPWEIIPGAPGLASGGGNFIVDPGEIGPAIPIKPLLGPTELAFGLPDEEEIFLLDDTEPEIGEVDNTRVDEDGFRFANVDVPLPTEFDGDENLTDTGNITVNYKSDVPGDLDAALVLDDLDSYDGQLQTLDGHDVVFALESGDLVGRSAGDNSEVIRISLQPGPDDLGAGFFTYTYEVTLSQPVEHPSNDTEDILTLVGIQFTATDEDGDSVSGTTDVEIIDDVPHAMNDCFVQMGEQDEKYPEKGPQPNLLPPDWMNGENESVSGNVLEDNGYGPDVMSADGEAEPVATLIGNSLSGTGNLTFNGDGSFEYEPGAGEEGDVTFQYYITDDDGDRSTATVTIKLQDDSEPAIDAFGTDVDEDGLGDANADDGLPTESSNGDSATNTGSIFVSYGNDVPADLDAAIVLNDLAAYDTELTSGGQPVVFAIDGGDLVGTIDGGSTEVIRISITNSTDNGFGNIEYEYTVTLSEEVDHPSNDNEDSVVLNGIQFTVTDGDDGDTATGTVDITIYDDVPEAKDDSESQISENESVTVDVMANDDEGADGVDWTDPTKVTSLSLSGSGTLTYNNDGSFTYEPAAGEDGTITFDYTIEDGDGDKSTATVTIELEDDSEPQAEAGGTEVDEDGFGFANVDLPTGLETDSTESLTDTGTVFVDYGNDLPGDIDAAFVLDDTPGLDGQLFSDGQTVTFLLETATGDLVGSVDGGSTEVIRISITDSTDNGDGSVDYEYTVELSEPLDHPSNDEEDSVFLTGVQFAATDGDDGDTVTGTFSVEIVDDVPTANDDGESQINENESVTIDVMTNDVDGADDVDWTDPTKVTSSSLSGSGTLTYNNDGSFTYEPAAGEDGTITFDYTIEDGDGDKSTATVTIDLQDDSEPTETSPNAEVDEDGFGFANVDLPTGLETDSTEDTTDVQTIQIDYGNDVPANVATAFTFDDLPAYDGQLVTLDGDDVEFAIEGGDLVGRSAGDNSEVIRIAITDITDNGDGTVDYEYTVTLSEPVEHPSNDTEDTVTLSGVQFTATDGDDGDQITGTFDIAVVDDVPTANDDGGSQINENDPITVDVMTNDVDGADDVDWTDPTKVTSSSLSGSGTLTYNNDGSFTYEPAAGEDGTITFDYTIEDGDGDKSTATVTIDLQDDSEPTETSPDAEVDEDGFGFANVDLPTGLETDSTEDTTDVQTIQIDYDNDVPANLATAFAFDDLPAYDGQLVTLDGFDVVFALEGGDLVGRSDDDASEVIRIAITDITDNGDGTVDYEYTVTLSQPVQHPTNDNEDFVTLTGVQFTATDGDDGDTVTGTFDVDVYDDVPTANDDGGSQINENDPITVDVMTNDVDGADDVDWTDPTKVTSSSLSGSGTLTYNNDGSFTYEPAAGEDGTITFDYTIEDGDGDKSTATVTIDLQDDSEPTETSPDAEVDEDGFTATANVDEPTGLETDSTESVTDIQTIQIDYGNDVPANLATAFTFDDLPAYDGQLVTLDGFDVVFAVEGGDLVGRSDDDASEVIRIAITDITDNGDGTVDYEYTVTLSQPVQHQDNDSEDTVTLTGVQFTATDGDDGDQVTGTFDVAVVDDVPTAVNDTDSTGEDTAVTTDVIDNDIIGADEPGTLIAATLTNTLSGTVSINSATGEVTYTPTAGFEGDSTITYTMEDADGDKSTATLTITVSPDSEPSQEAADAEVDEDGFTATANIDLPTGLETNSTESLTDVQTITIDYGNDTPGNINTAFTLDDLPAYDGQLVTLDGFDVVFALEGGDLVGRSDDDASEVIRIAITDATDNGDGTVDYEYTVTLSQPVQHGTNDYEDTETLSGIQFTATDSDGDSVTGTFDIDVVDDVPTANDDSESQIDENDPITVDVMTNDVDGADDVDWTDPTKVTSSSLSGSGTLTYNNDGSFTYEPAAGEDGTITFDYTIEDGDGDKSTATVTIDLQDDSEPTEESPDAEVDEDGFTATANVDLPTGLETDSTEDTTDVQTITINYGNDVPADINAAFTLNDLGTYDGQLVTLDGFDVVFALEGGDLVGRSDDDASEVIRIAITDSTDNGDGTVDYEYTVTLSQPVQHPTNDNEDFVTLSGIEFTATDGDDGDKVTGTFDIDVVDDVPTANDDSESQIDENDPITVDVMTNDVDGADDVDWTDPTKVTSSSLSGSGTLTYNNDGSFTYEPAAGEDGTITFDYTIEDGDGDKSTATVTIDLQDDSEPTEESPDAEVDEDGFTATANVDLPTGLETDSTEDTTDVQTITINYGNDVPADINAAFTLNDLGTYDGQLVTLDGFDVVFALEGGDLVGRSDDDASEVIRIAITDSTDNGDGTVDYEYTVTLSQPVQHPTNDNEDFVTLSGIEFTATDGDDGDKVTGTFDVAVYDDVPTAENDTDSTAEDTAVTTDVISNDVIGADQPGTLLSATLTDTTSGTISVNSATGEITFTPTAGFEGDSTITYTMEDADGDDSTATLTITVAPDSEPTQTATNAVVDEDGFTATANVDLPTGLEFDSTESLTGTGTIQIDYGNDTPGNIDTAFTLVDTGALDGQLVTLDGFDVVFALEGGDLVGRSDDDASEVIRIEVTSSTDNGDGTVDYEYTATLSQPIQHDTNDNEDTEVLSGIEFSATDSDGDNVTGTFTVTVYDDVPTAENDTDSTAEDTAVTTDVISNDVIGADQPGTLLSATLTDTTSGTISVNSATGEITFTPTAGFEGDSTITYTMEDADGDDSTATLTITVAPDSEPTQTATNAVVDEDGFTATANVDLPTGLEFDSTESLTGTGTIQIDYGNDTPGNIDTAFTLVDTGALDGQLVTLDGFDVVFALEGGDLVGRSDDDASEVIRIEVTSSTDNGDGTVDYEYTATLSQPIQHDTNDNEDTEVLSGIEFSATDSDGDNVTGTFTVTVYDDVPTAENDTTLTEGDTEVVVDVIANDVIGADQPGVLTGATLSDTTSGTVSINTATGEVSFTPAGGFEGDATITYSMEDADGDESTATLTVTVDVDDEPTQTATNAVVDEDGFTATANVDTPLATETDSTESLTGTGTVTIDYGDDTPGNIDTAFTLVDTGALDGQLVTLAGNTVVFALESGVLVGRDSVTTDIIITIEVTSSTDNGDGTVDYEYTATLVDPIQHPVNDNEDSDVLANIQFEATDSDGDSVTGTFDVTVFDDVPNLLVGDINTLTNGGPDSSSATLTFSPGADGLGGATWVGADNTSSTDTDGTTITAGGDPVLFVGYGTSTLTGYVDENGNDVYDDGVDTKVMTLELDPAGDNWTAELFVGVDNGTETDFDLVTGISGGNNNTQAVGSDDGANNTDNIDLIMEADPGTVNTSQGNIGIGGNFIDTGETVKIEFVSNAIADGGTPTGFDWEAIVETNTFRQTVTRVAGNQAQTAEFTVSAWATDGDQDVYGDGDDTLVPVENVIVYNTSGVIILNVETALYDSMAPSGGGVIYTVAVSEGPYNYVLTVTIDAGGEVSFTGMAEGWDYQIETDINDFFSGVTVAGDAGSDFNVGAFTLGVARATDPFDMDFDIIGFDDDGDEISQTLTIHFDQPVESLLAPASASTSSLSGEGESGFGGTTESPGFADTGGGFGEGTTGFLSNFVADETGSELHLLSGMLDQYTDGLSLFASMPVNVSLMGSTADSDFKSSSFVIDDAQLSHGLEIDLAGNQFGDLLGPDAIDNLSGLSTHNLPGGVELALSDMVDGSAQDLSSLLGQMPDLGGIETMAQGVGELTSVGPLTSVPNIDEIVFY